MNFRFERPGAVAVSALLGTLTLTVVAAPRALGQILPGAAPQTVPGNGALDGAALADRLSGDVNARLQQGRDLLDAGDARSATVLREAAQGALQVLQSANPAVADILTAPPGSLPDDALTLNLTARAAQAHLLWGIAAQRFARRDEAIAAMARAQRLVQVSAGVLPDDTLQRDINIETSKVLSEGLPLIAPDDVLGDIAQLVHGGLWTPRPFDFDESTIMGADTGAGNAEPSQFLITDGSLFPPPLPGNADIAPRTPSLYRQLDAEQLPASLKLNKMVAGYAREKSGPNRGQWRQRVRVFTLRSA